MANTIGEKELKRDYPHANPGFDREVFTAETGTNDPSVTEGGMEFTMQKDAYLSSVLTFPTSEYTSIALSGTTEGAMASTSIVNHKATFDTPQILLTGRVYRLSCTGGTSGYHGLDISELGTKSILIFTARYFNNTRQVSDNLMDITGMVFRRPVSATRYTDYQTNLVAEGFHGIKSIVPKKDMVGL